MMIELIVLWDADSSGKCRIEIDATAVLHDGHFAETFGK